MQLIISLLTAWQLPLRVWLQATLMQVSRAWVGFTWPQDLQMSWPCQPTLAHRSYSLPAFTGAATTEAMEVDLISDGSQNEYKFGDLTPEEAESFFGKTVLPALYIVLATFESDYPFGIDFSWSQDDCETLLFGLASKHFNVSKLHPFQARSTLKAISGYDTLIIQPTGKGKSLCYQLVALQQKKIVFVFTPTLALIYDQVMHLQASQHRPSWYLRLMPCEEAYVRGKQHHASCWKPPVFTFKLVWNKQCLWVPVPRSPSWQQCDFSSTWSHPRHHQTPPLHWSELPPPALQKIFSKYNYFWRLKLLKLSWPKFK